MSRNKRPSKGHCHFRHRVSIEARHSGDFQSKSILKCTGPSERSPSEKANTVWHSDKGGLWRQWEGEGLPEVGDGWTEHRSSQGSETVLAGATMVGTCLCTFAKAYRKYNTSVSPDMELWTLGGNDMCIKTNVQFGGINSGAVHACGGGARGISEYFHFPFNCFEPTTALKDKVYF